LWVKALIGHVRDSLGIARFSAIYRFPGYSIHDGSLIEVLGMRGWRKQDAARYIVHRSLHECFTPEHRHSCGATMSVHCRPLRVGRKYVPRAVFMPPEEYRKHRARSQRLDTYTARALLDGTVKLSDADWHL
jgi:hypothetical protein